MKRIDIKGAIISNDDKWIYDLFDYESTCPKDITSALSEIQHHEPIQVNINSGGGDVHSGSEIYTELKSHNGDVEIRIVGIAASAASVIAMAGKKVSMSPTAEFMIHNASMRAMGDFNTMDKASEILQTTNKAISSAYRIKTGLEEAELLELMNIETWMTAEQAKEKGFVDEIMFDNEQIQKVASAHGALPIEVLNKIRNDKLKEPETVTLDEVKEIMSQMKNDIVTELNNKQTKDIEPPVAKRNMANVFLNLGGK